MKQLNKEEIMQIIPQRDPFLWVDSIDELVPGIKAVGYKYIDPKLDIFKGHFPKEPVMPGVLLIEALAQTGAVAVMSLEENKGKTAYFAAIKSAKFKRKVVPNDTLKLECEIIRNSGAIGIGKAVASVNGEIAVIAELTFALG